MLLTLLLFLGLWLTEPVLSWVQVWKGDSRGKPEPVKTLHVSFQGA